MVRPRESAEVGLSCVVMRLSGIARRPRDVPHPPTVTSTLLERTTVNTQNGQLGKIETLEPFDLELSGGHEVRVRLAQHVRLEPVDARDTTWGDIENDPAFASLRAAAPGPHVEVHVRRSRVEVGAHVEVLAQDDDVEHVFGVGGSHRDAPDRQVSTVTARVIASGPDAAAVIDRLLLPKEKRPKPAKEEPPERGPTLKPRGSRAPLVVVLVALPFFAAASAIEVTPLTVDLVMTGTILVVSALSSWALSRVPRFVSDGKVLGPLGDTSPGRLVLFLMIVPLCFMFMGFFADHAGPWQAPNTPPDLVYNASWVSVVSLACWSLGVAFIALTRGQSEARLFRVLLGAPPLPAEGPLSRTWGSFEGVVRDPTPVTAEGEAVAIVHVISEEVVSGSDPNIFTERVLSKGTFFVDAPDESGRSIEIHPDGAVWTSSVALSIRKDRKRDKDIIEHIRAVPLRGNVLVAGRVDREPNSKVGRVASGGHESLLFVAVREGESPRNECRAMLVLRRIALLVALGGLAVAITTAVLVEPQLPSFNIPGGGD